VVSVSSDHHEPTFTQAKGLVGLYCSCGWVWGMGNQLGASRAFDNHMLKEAGIEALHH